MTTKQIDKVVNALDLSLDAPRLCRGCLLFVSSSLDEDNLPEARMWARRVTPTIWIEGYGDHALELVRAAASRGVARADEALADLEARGGRSPVARAIVMRLAAAQAAEDRAWRIARLN